MLSAPLLYLLKANAMLLLFAVGYFGLLRRLTFFALNRAYLLFGLLFAAVYPALPVPTLFAAVALGPVVTWTLGPTMAVVAGPAAAAFDWPAAALGLYGAGAALLLARLLGQLVSLARLHRATRPAVAPGGQLYRRLAGDGGPFSFGCTIYLNPDRHAAPELAAVLRHELAHVRQAHTLDVLLAHVALALFWANPAAWLLRRALLDNLEYLADQTALRTGLDRRAYQYQLLRLAPSTGGSSLVSPFSFLTLKNRILMMNQPASARLQLLRYLLAGPLVVALALAFSAAHAQTVTPTPAAAGAMSKPISTDAVYYVDGKRVDVATINVLNPKKIESMNVLQGPSAQALAGQESVGKVILVTTKANAKKPEVRAFNKKYSGVSVVAPKVGSALPTSNVAAPALAYITKNYPGSRITGATAAKNAKTSQPNFRVEIAQGRRPQYLVFNGQGQPVAE